MKQDRWDNMKKASKIWDKFKEGNQFKVSNVKVCGTCKHVDYDDEDTKHCQHPEAYNEKELGHWFMGDIHLSTVCDKWEVR